ncbi:MAG: LysR family transcriptional regulator [Burkholderiales bacterium]|nr:LysR family transcriptional regulator [Burkholderiales bacterium]
MAINWSVKELDVFIALADTLNYRRAAERTHMTQPGVSGVIARLEQSLEARLFDRTTRSVQLTAAGQALLAQVRVLRAQVDVAAASVRELRALRHGRVRLAALPSLACAVVPAAFARFAADHPQVRLELRDVLSGPALDLVRTGEVDFALTAAHPDYADLDSTPLAADRFVLLLPPAHPLAASTRPLGWAEVAALDHVSMPAPASVRQYAEAALLECGIRFAPKYEVEHLASIGAMVAAGLGVAALPELAARVCRSAPLVQRPLVAPDMRRPLSLITQRGRSLSPAASRMVELLQQALRQLTAPAARGAGPVKPATPTKAARPARRPPRAAGA